MDGDLGEEAEPSRSIGVLIRRTWKWEPGQKSRLTEGDLWVLKVFQAINLYRVSRMQ